MSFPAIIQKDTNGQLCLIASDGGGGCVYRYLEGADLEKYFPLSFPIDHVRRESIKHLQPGEGLECRLIAVVDDWTEQERDSDAEIRHEKVIPIATLTERRRQSLKISS